MASLFQQHVERWKDCRECNLCERRKHVVLLRGQIPADVLFIGEAPGQSEDVLGLPFIGPAGKLLDDIIADAVSRSELQAAPRMAWTNLVACIPKGDDDRKTEEPPEESIKACESRLIEIVQICRPRIIVNVGKLSKYYVCGQAMFGDCSWLDGKFMRFCEITHPAAILRADVTQQGLMIQRCRAYLVDAFDELTN